MFVGFSILMVGGFLIGFVTGFAMWITLRPYMEKKDE